MINYYLLFIYVTAIILFLGTPGPVTVMVANTSAKYGVRSGLATVAGTNTASLLLILMSFLIMQGLFTVSMQALSWLTLFGSFYLLYFAIGTMKEHIELSNMGNDESLKSTNNHFKDGFVVGISNPKDMLFFIAFFPTFFLITNDIYLSMIILTILWVILDYSILSIYSLVFSKIKNDRVVNLVSKTSGFILAAVAVYAIYRVILELI